MEKITEGKIRLAQASKLPAIPYKLKGARIIVFDTETTGVTEDDEIIQLSIIDGNGKTLINEYVTSLLEKGLGSSCTGKWNHSRDGERCTISA